MAGSMLNKWDYSGIDEVCYADDAQQSYIKAAAFLGDTVQDWGCGTCWAARFFTNYTGLDGSSSSCVAPADVVDLADYVSDPPVPNILCRWVLEYNADWLAVLDNIKQSFTEKCCLVIHLPESDTTHVMGYYPVYRADGSIVPGETIPEISFHFQDIRDRFPAAEYHVTEEVISNSMEYGSEWIMYVERLT